MKSHNSAPDSAMHMLQMGESWSIFIHFEGFAQNFRRLWRAKNLAGLCPAPRWPFWKQKKRSVSSPVLETEKTFLPSRVLALLEQQVGWARTRMRVPGSPPYPLSLRLRRIGSITLSDPQIIHLCNTRIIHNTVLYCYSHLT